MAATRAFSDHCDSRRVSAQALGIVVQPFQCGIVVLNGSAICRFGGQSVVDRYRNAVEISAHRLYAGKSPQGSTGRVTSSMGVEQGGPHTGLPAVYDINRYGRGTLGSQYDSLFVRNVGYWFRGEVLYRSPLPLQRRPGWGRLAGKHPQHLRSCRP